MSLNAASTLAANRGPTAANPAVARSLNQVLVVTPEGVLLEFGAAGIASRAVAKLVDLLLLIVAVIALVLAFTPMFALDGSIYIMVMTVSVFLLWFGYPALLETVWNGRTVGKALLGIRVITTEGGPVGFRHSAIRVTIWTIEFAILPGGIIALVTALLTTQSQRVGDLAAGTVVVRNRSLRNKPVFFAPAFGAEQFGFRLDVSRITPAQYSLIREFLIRTGDFSPDARFRLSEEMSIKVQSSTGVVRPSGLDGERFLVSVVFAYQQRFRPAGGASTEPPVSPPQAQPASLG